MKSTRNSNLLILHLIVLIWGLTGILGNEISLNAFHLVWWRVLLASCFIGLLAMWRGQDLRASARDILRFAGVGILTAAHWVCFFGSIKASKVSVALVVISTTAFFVSLLAPLIRREKFKYYELFLGLIVVTGLAFIFRFESEYSLGIILSLAAAILAAGFSVINSTLVVKHNPVKMAFWEMLFAFLGLSVYLGVTSGFKEEMFSLSGRDLSMLLVLGILCTGVAFIVSIRVMRVLSPFTCALAINLEPVYTILLAIALYGESEFMSPQFYLGAAIILSTLLLDAWLKRGQKAPDIQNKNGS